MSTEYLYSIQNDTLNGELDVTSLIEEVLADPLAATGYAYLRFPPYTEPNLPLDFYLGYEVALTGAQKAALDSVVATHAGVETIPTEALATNLDLQGNAILNVGTINGTVFSTFVGDTLTHVGTTSNPHATSLANLGTGTLADLNGVVTDATLDTNIAPRIPLPHSASHYQSGTDALDHNQLVNLVSGDPHTQYHTAGRWDTRFANKTTDDLTEGPGSLYYTEARVTSNPTVVANDAHSNSTANPHSITTSQIGAIPTAEKGSPSGVATLDPQGKVPAAQIPAIALPSFTVVVDIPARDALVVQEGDQCYVQSNDSFYIYDGAAWVFTGSTTPGIVGPPSSTDAAIALWDGTTGSALANSTVLVDLAGNLTAGTLNGVDITALSGNVGANTSGVSSNQSAITSHVGTTSNPHATSLTNLGTGTLADLNGVVTDATLDDSASPRTPLQHGASHYKGASDPLEAQLLSSGILGASEILVSDGLGGWATQSLSSTEEIPCVSLSNPTAQGLTTSYQEVALGAVNHIDSTTFSAGSTGTVTVLKAGLYNIQAYVLIGTIYGNVREQSSMRVMLNTGSGWSLIPGTVGSQYHRKSGQGRTNSAVTQVLTLPAGAQIRIEARNDSNSSNLEAIADGCGMVIRSLEGLRGPAGVGSTIQAREVGGTNITTSTLEFNPAAFTVTDMGSGQVRLGPVPKLYQQTETDTIVYLTGTSFTTLMSLTVAAAGTYQISGSLDAKANTSNLEFRLVYNGATLPASLRTLPATFWNAIGIGAIHMQAILPMVPNDTLEVQWRNVGSGTGTCKARSLHMIEI